MATNAERIKALEAKVAALEPKVADHEKRIDVNEEVVENHDHRIGALEGGAIPVPPEPPPTTAAGMWGGIAGYTLANTQVSPSGRGVWCAWSFIAQRSARVLSLRAYFTGGPGYGAGDGGRYDFSIVPGASEPATSATPLASVDGVTGFPPGTGNAPGKVVTFATSTPLVAGTRYWVVMENVAADPNAHNTSANAIVSQVSTGPRHWRWQDPLDWALMYRGSGAWTMRAGYAMCCQLDYEDGHAQGQPFMEMSYPTIPSRIGDIDGARLVRQPFTITAPVTVTALGIAAWKQAGSTGDVTIAIRDTGSGRGTSLASVIRPASTWPDGAMSGGDGNGIGGTKAWGGGALSETLQPGTYRLEVSESGGGRYLTAPLRGGWFFYGYSRAIDSAFPGGLCWQYSTDSGASWTNGDGSDDQLPVYLEQAA